MIRTVLALSLLSLAGAAQALEPSSKLLRGAWALSARG